MDNINLGPKTSCSLIHPDNPCIVEIVTKCATVVKKSSKMYVALYFAMIILQIGKLRKEKNRGKFLMKWFKDFLGSLAFMSWLVGGMKTSLCILNNLNAPLDGNRYINKVAQCSCYLESAQLQYSSMRNQNDKKSHIS